MVKGLQTGCATCILSVELCVVGHNYPKNNTTSNFFKDQTNLVQANFDHITKNNGNKTTHVYTTTDNILPLKHIHLYYTAF